MSPSRLGAAFVVALMVWLAGASAQAHEFRVASAELAWGEGRASLDVHVPAGSPFDPGSITPRLHGCALDEDSLAGRWRFTCSAAGPSALQVEGLDDYGADMFVRAEGPKLALDGVVGPTNDTLELRRPLSAAHSQWQTLRARVVGGFAHILEGWDHLLFLLALLAAVHGMRARLLAITAFTVGHSATLALAGLELVRPPSALVESLVALSIVVVAAAALRERGQPHAPERPAWRHALVPCAFGLLHGFAFAGALGELGVEGESKLVHLFGFNLGVEAGQLAVLLVAALVARAGTRFLGESRTKRWALALPWVAGVLGTAWWIERCLAFTGGAP